MSMLAVRPQEAAFLPHAEEGAGRLALQAPMSAVSTRPPHSSVCTHSQVHSRISTYATKCLATLSSLCCSHTMSIHRELAKASHAVSLPIKTEFMDSV
uniref:Uncharacterized protein n=1 Tax=Anguilla anguilla TaxID=7936 RepID=A0A0E9WL34_ANGAN